MLDPTKTQILLGPPGTGKTSRLLEIMETEMRGGVDPRRVGFMAFTRKAADVAKGRAIERFKCTEKDLPFFRTLHSLAFRQLGIKRDQVMQWSHYKELGEKLGMALRSRKNVEDGTTYGMTKEERMMFLEGLSRIKQEGLRDTWGDSDEEEIDWFELERYARALKEYKASRLVIDYTDMIDQFVEQHKVTVPTLDVLFIDEAQDLSPIQWAAVELIAAKAKRIYLAGDDDQAIYKWAGADVQHFINLQGNVKVLDQSHRVPSNVHPLAESIAKQIRKRRIKEYKPRNFAGAIRWYGDAEEVDLSRGTWLLLARNGYLLSGIEEMCIRNGFSFESVSHSPLQSDSLKAIKSWETLRKGNAVPIEEAMLVARFVTPGKGIRKETRDLLKTADQEAFVTLPELAANYGVYSQAVWFEFMDRIPTMEAEYFRAALKRKETLLGKPRITISTIHAAKGGEAENVMILTDMSYRTFNEMQKHPDDENRVWYVAVTRCLEALHLVSPKTNLCYEM
jgi:superfamily I DNA/RNA helicase